MALIEEYHVVADMYPVNPDTNPSLIEGMHVMLDADGFVVNATGATLTYCIGVCGDSTTEATGDSNNTPFQDSLVINAAGATRNTENRVSDMFNESLASSKMTVYQGGGKFHTDQYTTTDTYVTGAPLYVAATGILAHPAAANAQVVGICTAVPSQYPSGVPGTDTTDGSLSLGFYITFQQVNMFTLT
jgi:hypothetical protein